MAESGRCLPVLVALSLAIALGSLRAHGQDGTSPLRRSFDFWRSWSTEAGEMIPRKDPLDYQKKARWYSSRFFSDPIALEICSAIERDDMGEIDRLIGGGFDINHRGDHCMTFLFYSLMFPGRGTRHLLEMGADPLVPLDSSLVVGPVMGTTATHVIAGFGSPDDLRYLLNHGTDPNRMLPLHYEPILWSAYPSAENMRILLAAGAEVNLRAANRMRLPPPGKDQR